MAATAAARHGEVRVNRQIVGFKKVKFYTNENVGAGHLSLPEQEMHTTAFWIHFPHTFLAQMPEYSPTEKQAGLTGLANGLRAMAALLLMCDPRDLGVAITEDITGSLQTWEPDLFLYDNFPGGIGLAAPLHKGRSRLLELTAQLVAACSCEAGCPSCVGALGEVGEKGKQVALRVLRLLGAQPDQPEIVPAA